MKLNEKDCLIMILINTRQMLRLPHYQRSLMFKLGKEEEEVIACSNLCVHTVIEPAANMTHIIFCAPCDVTIIK